MFRIGMGFDVHAFAPDRDLMLGGVKIPWHQGLDGHSDADALVHAVVDAILGALGERDIGHFYPPDQAEWKDYPGCRFLADMREFLQKARYDIVNIDSVIMLERPKVSDYIPRMVEVFARQLDISAEQVGIKATTCERMGFVGREEGAMAQAVVLLRSSDRAGS